MKKLVTVTNREIINDLRENENISLLYPLKSFCVGYTVDFEITEIDDFCLVNRILNDDELDNLENILKMGHIKGIIFDDLGIIDVLKDVNITKILLLDHLATNISSINYYLDYVDSVVISNDLTEDEIRLIASCTKKPLVVNVFGLKTLMYSRRNLLSNYAIYHKLENKQVMDASIEEKSFRIVENEFGTKFYALKYYDALKLLDICNILYFWYDPVFLDKDKIIDVVIKNDTSNIKADTLFLDKKTIYKVGDIK